MNWQIAWVVFWYIARQHLGLHSARQTRGLRRRACRPSWAAGAGLGWHRQRPLPRRRLQGAPCASGRRFAGTLQGEKGGGGSVGCRWQTDQGRFENGPGDREGSSDSLAEQNCRGCSRVCGTEAGGCRLRLHTVVFFGVQPGSSRTLSYARRAQRQRARLERGLGFSECVQKHAASPRLEQRRNGRKGGNSLQRNRFG